MTPEELKTAWRTVLVPMELTDVEEALSYLVPAQRKPSRWMGLREEKFAKEFMEDVEDGAGNKMPKDLVLVLVDHWVERKRTKGQEDSSTMPVLAAAVVDAQCPRIHGAQGYFGADGTRAEARNEECGQGGARHGGQQSLW